MAAVKASQTGRAVARGVRTAQTQKRLWSSIPVMILSSRPPASLMPSTCVHLPELHHPQALPPPVVLALPSALLRLDQVVAQEAAVDRGAAGQR
jgi:hypothetical protein